MSNFNQLAIRADTAEITGIWTFRDGEVIGGMSAGQWSISGTAGHDGVLRFRRRQVDRWDIRVIDSNSGDLALRSIQGGSAGASSTAFFTFNATASTLTVGQTATYKGGAIMANLGNVSIGSGSSSRSGTLLELASVSVSTAPSRVYLYGDTESQLESDNSNNVRGIVEFDFRAGTSGDTYANAAVIKTMPTFTQHFTTGDGSRRFAHRGAIYASYSVTDAQKNNGLKLFVGGRTASTTDGTLGTAILYSFDVIGG